MLKPNEFKVKLDKRSDTYTGVLGFVNFQTINGDWKFKKSWDNWGWSVLKTEEHVNEPTSGFVINSNVGGHSRGSWYTSNDGREMKIRVYDPRGWEVEITLDNFFEDILPLGVTAGKGIETELVYVFNGNRLYLLPENSAKIQNINAILETKSNLLEDTYKVIDYDPKMGYEVGKIYFHDSVTAFVYIGKRKYIENHKIVNKNIFFKYNVDGKRISNSFFDTHKTSISPNKIKFVSGERIVTNETIDKLGLEPSYYPVLKPQDLVATTEEMSREKNIYTRVYDPSQKVYVLFSEISDKSNLPEGSPIQNYLKEAVIRHSEIQKRNSYNSYSFFCYVFVPYAEGLYSASYDTTDKTIRNAMIKLKWDELIVDRVHMDDKFLKNYDDEVFTSL